ncbi:hypothetical protein VSE1_03360 [Staphylococcus epidermidis]|nr:hypothetical protein AT255_10390 [Staphylococcus epidermidis FS1]RUN15978.1 hypothetical protein VSE1_03360 [Staphylococcus epidermidis]
MHKTLLFDVNFQIKLLMKMINLIKINNLKQLHETNRNCYDLKIILNEAHAVVNINDNYFQLKE